MCFNRIFWAQSVYVLFILVGEKFLTDFELHSWLMDNLCGGFLVKLGHIRDIHDGRHQSKSHPEYIQWGAVVWFDVS